MLNFALKHPWLTALLIVPTVVGGAVGLANALAATVTGVATKPKREGGR